MNWLISLYHCNKHGWKQIQREIKAASILSSPVFVVSLCVSYSSDEGHLHSPSRRPLGATLSNDLKPLRSRLDLRHRSRGEVKAESACRQQHSNLSAQHQKQTTNLNAQDPRLARAADHAVGVEPASLLLARPGSLQNVGLSRQTRCEPVATHGWWNVRKSAGFLGNARWC